MYLCKILAGDHADASAEILVEDGGEVEEEHQQHEVIPEASPGINRRHPLAEIDVPHRDEQRRPEGTGHMVPAISASEGLDALHSLHRSRQLAS